MRLSRAVARRPLFYLPVAAIAGGFLALATYTCNRAALRVRSQPRRGGYSSVFMVMRPSASLPLPRFEGEELTLSRPIMSNAEPADRCRNQAEPDELSWPSSQRYNFVANPLAGCHDVCELGRADDTFPVSAGSKAGGSGSTL